MAVNACINHDYRRIYCQFTFGSSQIHKTDPFVVVTRGRNRINSHASICSLFKSTIVRTDAGNRFRSRQPVMMMNSLSLTTAHCLRHLPTVSKHKAVIVGEPVTSDDEDDLNLILPDQDFSKHAHIPSFQKYLEMNKRSIEDPVGFWSEIASKFYWKKKWGQQVYSENLDITKGNINIKVVRNHADEEGKTCFSFGEIADDG